MNLFSLIIHPINFVNKFISFIKHKVEKIRSNKCLPDYLVVSGSKSMSGINDKKISIIKAHNFDYDLFIKKKQIIPNKKSIYDRSLLSNYEKKLNEQLKMRNQI